MLLAAGVKPSGIPHQEAFQIGKTGEAVRYELLVRQEE